MPDSLPRCISTFGADIDFVIWLVFGITTVWFVAAEGVLLWFAWRYRRRAGTRAAWAPGTTARSLAWILVPAAAVLVCDLGIEAASSKVWREVKIDAPERPDVLLRITGQQFSWRIRYAGDDRELDTPDDFVTVNEMHVPRGKVVRFELTSKDVVHSFSVAEMRLKQDAIPGRTIAGWFDANAVGTYTIACAELCGPGHTVMKGKMVVESPEAFAKWSEAHAPK